MSKHILTGTIAAVLVAASCATAAAQDASSESARLQKLEQAVSQLQQENTQLKSMLNGPIPTDASTASGTPGAAGKFVLSAPVTQIQLFGDLLLCYRVNEGVAAGKDAGDTGQQDRLRYRLHLGANIAVTDGWTMGVVLETASIGRGALVTLGGQGFNDGNFAKANTTTTTAVTSITTTSSKFVTAVTTTGEKISGATTLASLKTTTGSGISKASTSTASVVNKVVYGDELFVGQVFLKYQPADWISIEAGKFRPNLVSTRMIWDADICPEGLGENFQWHFGAPLGAHGDAGAAGYDKDGKESKMVAPAPGGMSFDLFANFAQYIYDDAGFENTFNTYNAGTGAFSETPNNTSNWLLGWQIGGKLNVNPSTYFQLAATYYNYTGGGTFSSGSFNGDNALVIYNKNAIPSLLTFNQTATNDLGIVDFPVEFGFKIGNFPIKIIGDFADNLYASERASNAGHPDKGNEGIAWQAGLQLGEIKKKGDWEIRGWYQKSEEFALDPNLVDDDIFDGRLNMEGFYVRAAYALADAVTVTLEYSNGHRIDSSLGTAGVGQLGTAAGFPLQSVNFIYASVVLKF